MENISSKETGAWKIHLNHSNQLIHLILCSKCPLWKKHYLFFYVLFFFFCLICNLYCNYNVNLPMLHSNNQMENSAKTFGIRVCFNRMYSTTTAGAYPCQRNRQDNSLKLLMGAFSLCLQNTK